MLLAPDPPRDTTSDGDELSTDDVHNFIILNEEDMGEGEHELDFSSHESDLTDDDDDQENPMGEASNNNDGNIQVRGRYQLLIPFVNTNNTDDPSVQEFHGPTNEEEDDVEDGDGESQQQQPHETLESSFQSVNQEVAKREISMNNEKVETIKNVMKNFSLPQSSIPGWAKELNEDVWKTKLISKLEGEASTDPQDLKTVATKTDVNSDAKNS